MTPAMFSKQRTWTRTSPIRLPRAQLASAQETPHSCAHTRPPDSKPNKVKESSRAVRGAFRGSRAEQLCGLRLAALHKGTFFPLSTWSMYTYMVMYGRTWTRAAREQRSLGKFPAVTPRLAVSVRPLALVVSRLVTSKSSHPAAQKPIHLPEPLCPKSAGNQPTSCRAQESKEVGECCFHSQPSGWPFAQLPTHPSPQFLRCPGRPMTQCYSSFGNAGAWVLRLGPRDTTSQTQPASRSSGVRLLRSNPELVAAAQERDKLATCPGSTFYFAPRDLPLVFFGPGGEQSPTSTLASCKCHLRAALPRPCTCTTLRGHHRGTYQPRPPFICPVLRSVASSVPHLV